MHILCNSKKYDKLVLLLVVLFTCEDRRRYSRERARSRSICINYSILVILMLSPDLHYRETRIEADHVGVVAARGFPPIIVLAFLVTFLDLSTTFSRLPKIENVVRRPVLGCIDADLCK